MLRFIAKRLIFAIPTLFAVSIIAFIIIQLPPGDYLTTLMADWASQGGAVEAGTVAAMRERYGLDQPIYFQYYKWIAGILLHGDFGISFELGKPVTELIWGRLGFSLLLSFLTLCFVWAIAIPIGILSAVRQYSISDYSATFLAFFFLAVPDFLMALSADVRHVGLFRAERRRAVLAGLCRRALELREASRLRAACLAAGHRHRPRVARRTRAHHARQPARRTLEALCHHGARQGHVGVRAAASATRCASRSTR